MTFLSVFGTGSMIHDGFKIATLFEGNVLSSLQCHGPLYILVAVIHMIFTFVQTYFLFKSHRVGSAINLKQLYFELYCSPFLIEHL